MPGGVRGWGRNAPAYSIIKFSIFFETFPFAVFLE
jgi:hypothetical protein